MRNIMKKIKICNRCNEIFSSNSLEQFAPCPNCKVGEIVFVDEAEYIKACSDDEEREYFLATLVEYGSPESYRRLEVGCTFYKKKDAEEFVIEIEEKSLFHNMAVAGHRNEWTVNGSTPVKLKEIPQVIQEAENVIQKYNTYQIAEWIKVRFLV